MTASLRHNFDALDNWAQVLISRLDAKGRRKLMRTLALDLRRANQKRITAQVDPDGSPWEPRKPQNRGTPKIRDKKGRIRRKKKMLLGLRDGRRLKVTSSPNALTVGFSGKTARIARIHHYGLKERMAPNGIMVQYAERQLLGISGEDESRLRDLLLEHLSAG